jgi:hypothetical protein
MQSGVLSCLHCLLLRLLVAVGHLSLALQTWFCSTVGRRLQGGRREPLRQTGKDLTGDAVTQGFADTTAIELQKLI